MEEHKDCWRVVCQAKDSLTVLARRFGTEADAIAYVANIHAIHVACCFAYLVKKESSLVAEGIPCP